MTVTALEALAAYISPPENEGFAELSSYVTESGAHGWSEEAALDRKATTAFVGAMMVYIFAYKKAWPSPAVVSHLPIWIGNAQHFFTRFDLDPTPFNDLGQATGGEEWDQEAWDSNLYGIGQQIAGLGTLLSMETDIDKQFLTIIGHIKTWCNTGSDSSWKNIQGGVPSLRNSALNAMYSELISTEKEEDMPDQEAAAVRMMQIVQTLTKERRYLLKLDEAKKFSKGTKRLQDLYREYDVLKKQCGEIEKRKIKRILMNNHGPMNAKTLAIQLDDSGVLVCTVPTQLPDHVLLGLNGEGKMAMFTNTGLEIRGALPNTFDKITKGAWPDNPNAYVIQFSGPGRKTETRCYTFQGAQENKVKKGNIVNELIGRIEDVRSKWERTILGAPPRNRPKDPICALMLHLCYDLGSRIGSNKKDANKGLSVLRVKHLTFAGRGFKLDYIGKKGVHQVHNYTPEGPLGTKVLKMMHALADGRDEDDWLFHIGGTRITETDANSYFKSIGGPEEKGVGVHSLRHVRGTLLAQQVMAQEVFELSAEGLAKPSVAQREAEEWYKDKVGNAVGLALGHKKADGETQAMTSIENYIDPAFTKSFFENLKDKGVRIPVAWKVFKNERAA